MPNAATTTVTCPDCAHPAVVLGRFDLPSAGGPVEYLRIRCSGSLSLIVAAAELRDLRPVTGERARSASG